MSRCTAIGLALLGAAGAFAADNPPADAPLSDTKRQLQALQRDAAAQKTEMPSGLRLDLPTMNTPGLTDLNLTKPEKDEDKDAQKRNARRKNWLLDGYDKLDTKKNGAGDARDKKDGEMGEEDKLDPKDPDYFLHVYEKQRAESDAKQREFANANMQQADTKLAGSADPFAPFMKEWLANSPVRDVIRDSSSSTISASGGEPTTAAVGTPSDSRSTVGSGGVSDSLRPNASNPFLQSLGLSGAEAVAKSNDFRAPVAEPAFKNVFENRSAPTPDPTLSRERPRDEVRNAVPPPPDDKKYFPQLKKF